MDSTTGMTEMTTFVAKTHYGLEEVLAAELEKLGAEDTEILTRAVSFSGSKEMLYAANLRLRTALRILKPIYSFRARNEKQFYKGIQEIDWSEYLDPDATLAIDSAVSSDFFSNSRYISMLGKDAIADQFREKTGIRPSVDLSDPALRINIHIFEDQCTVSLDSSGDSLHKRGYRADVDVAPLNEALAAGMILLTRWNGEGNFVDPMCGSGTILIEAAMIALDMAPGLYRKSFGFMKWKDFDKKLWDSVVVDTIARKKEVPGLHIAGADISGSIIELARENVAMAGLGDVIELTAKRIEHFTPPGGGGVLVTNPPYGERLQNVDVEALYKVMGDQFKQKYSGYECWMLSSNREALKHVGLRASPKIKLYNGPLECRFVRYSMYEGTRRSKYLQQGESEG